MCSREEIAKILPDGLDEDLVEYICGALEDEDARENAEDVEELVSSVLIDADLASVSSRTMQHSSSVAPQVHLFD